MGNMIGIARIALAAALAPVPAARAARVPFDVSGGVILVNGGDVSQILLSTDRGIFQCWDTTDGSSGYRPGDTVRLLGYDDGDSDAFPTRYATNATIVSKLSAAFDPPAVDPRGLLAGDFKGKPVAVQGVVVSVMRDDIDSQWNWIVLNTSAGRVFAAVTENTIPLDSMRNLPDAEVVLRGVAARSSACRAFIPQTLFLSGANGLTVAKPAPADPFAANHAGKYADLHRKAHGGLVVGHGRKVVFITADRGKFMPVFLAAEAGAPPEIGMEVTVAGFESFGQTGMQITEAVVRKDSAPRRGMSAPVRLPAKDLFTDASGHDIANLNYANRIVSVRGTVESSAESHRLAGVAFLDVAGHRIALDLSNVAESLPPDFGHGYEIDASGICYAEFDNSPSLSFPAFKGFTIYPRCAADVAVVKSPPWLTLSLVLAIAGILAVALAAAVAWSRTLTALSVRRGHELAREQLRNARSSLKAEERTNLAVELHDSISQTLVGVAMQIETALGVSGDALGPSRRFLVAARQMLASCRHELKCCLWDLRNRAFENRDIAEVLRRTIAPHLGGASAAVRFNTLRNSLSERSTHAIVRIVRELVSNAVRHGKARNIRIAGELRDGTVRFSVRDDGCGFDPAAAAGPEQGHFGLAGVRERAKKMGGSAEIASTPGKGTKVTVAFREAVV